VVSNLRIALWHMVLMVIGVEAEAVTLLSARAGIRKPGADGETLVVTEYAVCDIGGRRGNEPASHGLPNLGAR
jgi:hypothetical protein